MIKEAINLFNGGCVALHLSKAVKDISSIEHVINWLFCAMYQNGIMETCISVT